MEGSACDPIVHVRRFTPAERAFERRDGTCVEAAIQPNTFVAGDEVPAATFIEGTPATL